MKINLFLTMFFALITISLNAQRTVNIQPSNSSINTGECPTRGPFSPCTCHFPHREGTTINSNFVQIQGNSQISTNQNGQQSFIRRNFKIKQSTKTHWYEWSCKDGSAHGFTVNRANARKAGRANCGEANFGIREISLQDMPVPNSNSQHY